LESFTIHLEDLMSRILLRRALGWHRPLMLFAAAMVVTGLIAAGGLVVDDRELVGAPIWAKPLKFAISFTLYSLTWAWMVGKLTRARRAAWWAGTVLAVAGAIEMLVIVGQVVRGTRSHFNTETPFDQLAFNLMGATIVVLFTGHLVLGAMLLWQRAADRVSAAAVRLGTFVSAVGLGLGALMLPPTPEQIAADARGETVTSRGGHSVGVPDGGAGMPLTGWSTEGGDLRIPHFVGMHALQLLPLLAIALTLAATRVVVLRDAGVRLRLVRIAASGYLGLTLLLTWQALRGQPLVRPDTLTLAALCGLVATVAVACLYTVRQPPSLGEERPAPAGTGAAR
jgi:hypothetical protein